MQMTVFFLTLMYLKTTTKSSLRLLFRTRWRPPLQSSLAGCVPQAFDHSRWFPLDLLWLIRISTIQCWVPRLTMGPDSKLTGVSRSFLMILNQALFADLYGCLSIFFFFFFFLYKSVYGTRDFCDHWSPTSLRRGSFVDKRMKYC